MKLTNNSLTTLLDDLLRLQTNAYDIISSLSELVSSNSDTVTLDIQDRKGVIKKVSLPSFGSFATKISKIEKDIEQLAGFDQSTSSLRLSDGKFRKILVSKLKKEAKDISSISAPTSFATKENWFFESFLNPLLYVTFDFSNQIKSDTERVEVARYVLNLDTEKKTKLFEDSIKGNDDIKFQDFYEILTDNNITFFKDQSVIDLPPRTVRYYGHFSVTDITDETETTVTEEVESSRRILRVRLDSLNYNDRQSRFLGTQSLKIGDSLVVNNNVENTRYQIESIDSDTRSVTLRLIEGFDPIKIGADTLSFYEEDESSVSVDVNIGFNENTVIFVRPIDPDSKIAAINWSPGVGFYTNDLITINENDQEVSLSTYYQNSVIDFGAHLYSMAKEGIPPSILGVVPAAPTLDPEDFQVVKINDHRTETPEIENLKVLQEDKIRVNTEIESIDGEIKKLQRKKTTVKYSSKKVEDSDKNKLKKLGKERDALSKRQKSIVEGINTVSTSASVSGLKPKYRLRGFFPIPTPKSTDRTKPQEIVQFVTRYRYVKKSGGANKPEQINFKDTNGEERRGTFSTWVEVKSDVRKRITDAETGEIRWDVEDVESGDAVNINQIDIAISPGEGVELQVKSLSEAGWPINPKTSNWSEVVKVDFPDELESIKEVDSIIENAKEDKILIGLENKLESLGLIEHVSSQTTQGGNLYKHNSTEIASGFFDSSKGVISMFEKLTSIDAELERLKSLIEKAKGKLVVRFIDDIGQEFPVEPNSTLKIFAGNYKDEVASLPVKKGVIITKNYFLRISNEAASNLELYAREFGTNKSMITESYSSGTNYKVNDDDYNVIRRYDYVPLGLSDPDAGDVNTYGFIQNYPSQSSQVLGQFINSRFKSIDGLKNLYSEVGGATYGVYNSRAITEGAPQFFSLETEDLEEYCDSVILNAISASSNIGSTANGDFIWKGGVNDAWVIPSSDPLVTSNLSNSILVHINHPYIKEWSISASTNSGVNLNVQDEVRNSVFANIPVGSTGWDRQTALFYEGAGATADKYSKVGFEDSDQYLIGPRSTGAYLFMAPKDHKLISVNGADSISQKIIQHGVKGSLVIPVIFQYRMTDYYGEGDTGIGNINGDPNANSRTNITYTKTLGLDIYSDPVDRERFSFDIEITARYYSQSVSSKEGPLRTFENSIDDLINSGLTVAPSTSRSVSSS